MHFQPTIMILIKIVCTFVCWELFFSYINFEKQNEPGTLDRFWKALSWEPPLSQLFLFFLRCVVLTGYKLHKQSGAKLPLFFFLSFFLFLKPLYYTICMQMFNAGVNLSHRSPQLQRHSQPIAAAVAQGSALAAKT